VGAGAGFGFGGKLPDVPTTTFPYAPAPTQSDVRVQETPSKNIAASSTCTTCQDAAPLAGRVDVTTFPALSTATHSDVDGHEAPSSVRELLST